MKNHKIMINDVQYYHAKSQIKIQPVYGERKQ
jgi:hypothetical protein